LRRDSFEIALIISSNIRDWDARIHPLVNITKKTYEDEKLVNTEKYTISRSSWYNRSEGHASIHTKEVCTTRRGLGLKAVTFTRTKIEVAEALPPTDMNLWKELTEACERFHLQGGGLFIFADNDPFCAHANAILSRIVDTTLDGDVPAGKNLTLGVATETGKFGEHLITTGLKTLYEGVTVSYPKEKSLGKLEIVATGTDNFPVVLCAEPQYKRGDGQTVGTLESKRGRVVVDTGFTKLWVQWKSAGTARYFGNAAVWLLGLDYRLQEGLPLHGVLRTDEEIAIEMRKTRDKVVKLR